MMDCNQARDHLGAYYDGECPEAVRAEVVKHLSGCRACQHSLDEWVSLSARVFPKGGAKAPAFLWTRVLAGIEAREAERSVWWRQWRWMGTVTMVASLLISLGSFYLWRHSAVPLETALEGVSTHQEAIQLASMAISEPDQSTTALIEGDSWAEN